MKTIKVLSTKNLSWVNVTKPGEKEIKYLKGKFNFHSLDLKDCLPPLQRPKLEVRPNYLFMILLFPIFNRRTKEIYPSEIDFFISENTLVTVHNNKHPSLVDFFKICQKKPFQEKYLFGSPAILLYEILNRLLLSCYPMLNHISLDIDQVKKQIFNGYEKKIAREILIIKSNIVIFRKTIQAHKNVIKKLIINASQFFSTARLNIYLDALVEHTREIWDLLEGYKETINALHETNESLISYRLNEIMKLLTIISVIMLPAALIANLFGMNIPGLPFVKTPFAFWIVFFIMLLISLGMIRCFKKRGWF